MKRTPVVVLLIVALAGFIALVWPGRTTTPSGTDQSLTCYVGGTMVPAFTALKDAYEKATGRRVDITAADSGELLATIEMQRQGDLYVAHDPFMDLAVRRGLGANAWCVAEIFPVMIVQKGNPKDIRSLKDLLRPDLRVLLTDYEHSTLGRMLPIIFKRGGLDFDAFNRAKKVPTHRSGSWVANQVIMDAADVAMVWQAVAFLRRKDLDIVHIDQALPIPGVDAVTSATGQRYFVAPVKVGLVSLTCSQNQVGSNAFVDFVTSPLGRQILKDFGFQLSDLCGQRFYENGVPVQPRSPELTAGTHH